MVQVQLRLILPGYRVAGPICILLFAFLTLYTS